MGILRSSISGCLKWMRSPEAALLIGEPLFTISGMRGGRGPVLGACKNILVVKLDEIGDAVMATPFLRELRKNAAGAHITLVIKPQAQNLVELCPYVNEVLAFDWCARGGLGGLARHGRAISLAKRKLWKRRFDLAVIPRWDIDWYHASFVSYFSGARWRAGYSENVLKAKCVENSGYDKLFTHLMEESALKHEVERNLDIIKYLGGVVRDSLLELWLSDEDEAYARGALGPVETHGGKPFYALAPGAGAEKRRWDISNYISLGRWLIDEYKAGLLVLGGKGEESLGGKLREVLGDDVVEMAGRTTLRQAGALLKRCRMYIGSDSGLMHIAAAAGIPVVEISCHPSDGQIGHYNSPVRFGPWGVPKRVMQPEKAIYPCTDSCSELKSHCISSVSLESVRHSIIELNGFTGY